MAPIQRQVSFPTEEHVPSAYAAQRTTTTPIKMQATPWITNTMMFTIILPIIYKRNIVKLVKVTFLWKSNFRITWSLLNCFLENLRWMWQILLTFTFFDFDFFNFVFICSFKKLKFFSMTFKLWCCNSPKFHYHDITINIEKYTFKTKIVLYPSVFLEFL